MKIYQAVELEGYGVGTPYAQRTEFGVQLISQGDFAASNSSCSLSCTRLGKTWPCGSRAWQVSRRQQKVGQPRPHRRRTSCRRNPNERERRTWPEPRVVALAARIQSSCRHRPQDSAPKRHEARRLVAERRSAITEAQCATCRSPTRLFDLVEHRSET